MTSAGKSYKSLSTVNYPCTPSTPTNGTYYYLADLLLTVVTCGYTSTSSTSSYAFVPSTSKPANMFVLSAIPATWGYPNMTVFVYQSIAGFNDDKNGMPNIVGQSTGNTVNLSKALTSAGNCTNTLINSLVTTCD